MGYRINPECHFLTPGGQGQEPKDYINLWSGINLGSKEEVSGMNLGSKAS